MLAGFQAEFMAKPAQLAAPAVAQVQLACKPPFWTQVRRAKNYKDFAIWNPNTLWDIWVCLKQLPCTLEQLQSCIPAL